MKSILFYLMMLLLSISVQARSGNISGRIMDDKGAPLADANVVLLNAKDSGLVKADLTDGNGRYNITPVANGTYLMKVMLVGYDTYSSEQVVVTDNTVAMPDIKLRSNSTQLKAVDVRGQKPFVEVHPDKLVVNVESSIVSAGSSALEVLARSPGVTVDQNDQVSLKGKQGVNILINGKVQPISGTDLANVLKSMPSSTIDRIELISNPSAKYDAAGTGGIINIILKKDQHMGANGSINGTYAQGVYPKANGGFNINYRNKKFNLYASYNNSYREGFNHLVLARNFFDNNVNDFTYKQDHQSKFPFRSQAATVGLDYNISAKTTIGVVLGGGLNSFDSKSTVNSLTIDPANRDAHIDSSYTKESSANSWNNYSVNLNLKHEFDKMGQQLTADVDFARYTSLSSTDLSTQFFALDSLYLLHGHLPGSTQIESFNTDYTKPFKNGIKLEGGIKASYVIADNSPLFTDESTGEPRVDAGKTNHFVYTENINAVYVNLSKDWTKWSAQFGLRGEQTVVTGDQKTTDSVFHRDYAQLFPSFAVQRHLDKNNDLGLTLSRRIERPNYEQLNSFRYYMDPTTRTEGDPYLNPALSYSIELSHTYKQRFITTLNFTITKDVITEVLLPAEDRITVQSTRNIGQMRYYGVSCAYPFNITKWWTNNTNFDAFYSEYIGNLANSPIDNGKPTFDINTTNSFILPKGFSAEAGLFYQAEQYYGYMDLDPQWMVNFGIQKNLWEKRATIKLNARDIFWHGYPSATSVYNGYNENFIAKRDTRQFSLSFTYRFGKNTVPPIRRHNGGAEDEKRRVGGAG